MVGLQKVKDDPPADFHFENGGPPTDIDWKISVVEVRRGVRKEKLLCVRCDNPKDAVCSGAGAIVAQLLKIGGDSMHEVDSNDHDLCEALEAKGAPWCEEPFLLVAAARGCFAGLRAVGVGSNLRKRRRAAQVSLVASAALAHGLDAAAAGPDFARLLKLAAEVVAAAEAAPVPKAAAAAKAASEVSTAGGAPRTGERRGTAARAARAARATSPRHIDAGDAPAPRRPRDASGALVLAAWASSPRHTREKRPNFQGQISND